MIRVLAASSLLALTTFSMPSSSFANDSSEMAPTRSEVSMEQLWENRLKDLVDLIESDIDNYIVPENIYTNGTVSEVIHVLAMMQSSAIMADHERLIKRLEFLSQETKQPYLKSLSELFDKYAPVDQEYYDKNDKLVEFDKNSSLDNHHLVSFYRNYLERSAIQSLSSYRDHRMSQRMWTLLPSLENPLHPVSKISLLEIEANEAAYTHNPDATYQSLLEIIYTAKKNDLQPYVITSTMNLFDNVRNRYPDANIEDLSLRLASLDIPDPALKGQTLFQHVHHFYDSNNISDHHLSLLIEAADRPAMKPYLSTYIKTSIVSAAFSKNKIDLFEKYMSDPDVSNYINNSTHSSLALFVKVHNGEMSLTKAYKNQLRIRNDTIDSIRINSSLTDTTNYNGLSIDGAKVVPNNDAQNDTLDILLDTSEQILSTHDKSKLSRIQSQILVAERVSSNDESSPSRSLHALAMNSELYEFPIEESNSSSSIFNQFIKDNIGSLLTGKASPIYLSNLRRSYPRLFLQPPSDDLSLFTEYEKAILEVIKLNLELKSGRIENTWERIFVLQNATFKNLKEHSIIQYELGLLKAQLLFLEGNVGLLISQIDENVQNGIDLKIPVNAPDALLMLSYTLMENDYIDAASETVNALSTYEGSSVFSNHILPALRSDIYSKRGNHKAALAQNSVALNSVSNEFDKALLINQKLMILNNSPELGSIQNTVDTLDKQLDLINDEKFFKKLQPSFFLSHLTNEKLRTGYESPDLLSRYNKSVAISYQQDARTKSDLRKSRSDGEKINIDFASDRLAKSVAKSEKFSKLIKFLTFISFLLFIISTSAFLMAFRRDRLAKKILTNAEQIQRHNNRALRDSFAETKRFAARIRQHTNRLSRSNISMSDQEIIDYVCEDLDLFCTKTAKDSFIRRTEGQLPVSLPERLDMTKFTDELAQYWSSQLIGPDIVLTVTKTGPLPDIMIDRHFLEVVISETAENSLTNTLYGNIRIDVSYNIDVNCLILVIEDTAKTFLNANEMYPLSSKALMSFGGSIVLHKIDEGGRKLTINLPAPLYVHQPEAPKELLRTNKIPLEEASNIILFRKSNDS